MEKQKLKTGDLIEFNQGMDKGVIALINWCRKDKQSEKLNVEVSNI
jgi:hypothetical protein